MSNRVRLALTLFSSKRRKNDGSYARFTARALALPASGVRLQTGQPAACLLFDRAGAAQPDADGDDAEQHVHRARRHRKEAAAPAGRLHHAPAFPKALRRRRLESGQLLAAALQFADRRARLGHSGHRGGRHGRVVHHAIRPQMQKIHLGCLRLPLHDARVDARLVLDEHVPKQPGRRRQHRHGGIHLRRMHAGVVRLRPVPDDYRHGAALFPVRVPAHRRHPQKHGRDARGERDDPQGQPRDNHPPRDHPDRHARHPLDLPADLLQRLQLLHRAGVPRRSSATRSPPRCAR